jgi:small-conductance mechanosensitive channel
MLANLREQSPAWLQAWFVEATLLVQVVLIVLAAFVLRWLMDRLILRISRRYDLPIQIRVSARRIVGFLIGFGALLMVLERFGVSGGVLWTAFTGFAAVAAIAFFAAWSVLTNIFWLQDHIELLEGGDRPGLRGQVVDMNLIYVTLLEAHPEGGESVLRIPNSLFFQRSTRRWKGEPVALPVPAGVGDRPPSQPAAGGGTSAMQFP